MVNIVLVKKVRRSWDCFMCGKEIKEGSMMIRESENKWVNYVYCKDCGKDKLYDKLKDVEKFIKEMKEKKEYYIKFIFDDYVEFVKKLKEWIELVENKIKDGGE